MMVKRSVDKTVQLKYGLELFFQQKKTKTFNVSEFSALARYKWSQAKHTSFMLFG